MLPCRESKSLLGEILAEGILVLLSNGVYSFGKLVPNELHNALMSLCKTGVDDYLMEVQNLMEKKYSRTSRNHCILVVSQLLRRQYSAGMDVELSAKQYFFDVPNDLLQEICARGKGSA